MVDPIIQVPGDRGGSCTHLHRVSNDRDLVSLIVSYMLLQNAVNHKVAWPIICMKVTHKLGFAFGLHLLHSESSTEAYLKPWLIQPLPEKVLLCL